MDVTDSFPRRQALTRRFTLGEPRDIRVSSDGARVVFLRSSGPVDAVNSLWVLDVAAGVERLVADPRHLAEPSGRGTHDGDGDRDGENTGGDAGGDVPAAERARRERVRETAGGIVSYDVDDTLTTAAFALGGRLWRVSLRDGGRPELLAASPGAFDPRLAPDCARVAYVAGSSLRVTGDARGDRLVAHDSSDTVSWGAAEFVAAEEMGRTRGHWWSPDGEHLLAARVDTAAVPSWWIADPASPGREPAQIRYPAAGQPNAEVSLAVLDAGAGAGTGDGDSGGEAGPSGSGRVVVAWDSDGWEYLAGVRWSADGLILTVQTRDQRTLGVLQADPGTGLCRLLRTVTDDAWVELVPGVPRLVGRKLVTVEDRAPARRLCLDGEALTGDDIQVRSVHHADDGGVIITASIDPAEVHVVRVGWDGGLQWLTSGPGVHGVAVGGDTVVLTGRSLEHPGGRCTVQSRLRPEPGLPVATHAAEPGLDLNVEIVELGPRR
ncbi:MAG: DPP IV N-terminal domain-containing protein, partial [Acidimicrobiaceae bacterium]|nr:DPP IV N-terminal domain-containing protein [Acidimicrobiaceae bacterium]